MDLNLLAQYGIAGASMAMLIYIITVLMKQYIECRTVDEFKELTKAIENNGHAITRLCFLIEQQAVFMQRLMERLDALWEKTISGQR